MLKPFHSAYITIILATSVLVYSILFLFDSFDDSELSQYSRFVDQSTNEEKSSMVDSEVTHPNSVDHTNPNKNASIIRSSLTRESNNSNLQQLNKVVDLPVFIGENGDADAVIYDTTPSPVFIGEPKDADAIIYDTTPSPVFIGEPKDADAIIYDTTPSPVSVEDLLM
jgi:hypothetical protein